MLVDMNIYSTKRVAQMVGISLATLHRWLLYSEPRLREPRRMKNGGINIRIWTPRDVERVRKYKAAHYLKERGRKKKGK